MSSTKYDIDKFTGVNDFGLWHFKMQSLQVQQGLLETLKRSRKMDDSLMKKKKKTMVEKAHSEIMLSLGDKVLQQVLKEKTSAGV